MGQGASHDPVEYLPAARAAFAAFGHADGQIETVSLSENVTCRATASDGTDYVLRLHRPGYHTFAELDSERHWLAGLRAAGLGVPEPLPFPDGDFYKPFGVEATGETRYVGFSRWVEGTVVAELDTPGATSDDIGPLFGQLGELMAAMHDQAVAWTPPTGYTRHRFDLDGLLGEAPFWGRFWEVPGLSGEEVDVLVAARTAATKVLTDYGEPPDRFSMIHADLHLANLLQRPDGVGIIDFDDSGFGWHQYDIAVALFHSTDAPDFPAARKRFLDGYRSVRAIGDDDLALVPMFEMIRGMAILGWKAQRPEVDWDPEFEEGMRAHILDRCRAWLAAN